VEHKARCNATSDKASIQEITTKAHTHTQRVLGASVCYERRIIACCNCTALIVEWDNHSFGMLNNVFIYECALERDRQLCGQQLLFVNPCVFACSFRHDAQ